jgi:Ser/Thr protein kinase RdoA (MazF antagonist)
MRVAHHERRPSRRSRHAQPPDAEAALRPWTPVFTHGDLQITHVFIDKDEITGVIDWSGAGQGDALYDLAILTLGHQEHLGDVVAGYGTGVDLDMIRAWWSLRSLQAARWLIEHGFDPSSPGCEFDVLRSSCEAARAARVTDAPSCNIRARRVAQIWLTTVAHLPTEDRPSQTMSSPT